MSSKQGSLFTFKIILIKLIQKLVKNIFKHKFTFIFVIKLKHNMNFFCEFDI